MVDALSRKSMDSATVACELDASHERACVAFAQLDAEGYMAMFHPSLVYMHPDGRTMRHDQLARDLREQFARAQTTWCEFRRTSLDIQNARMATETLEQHTLFAGRARMFGGLRRDWAVIRRGRCEWVRGAATWQVRRVEVFWEEVAGKFSQMVGGDHEPLSDVT